MTCESTGGSFHRSRSFSTVSVFAVSATAVAEEKTESMYAEKLFPPERTTRFGFQCSVGSSHQVVVPVYDTWASQDLHEVVLRCCLPPELSVEDLHVSHKEEDPGFYFLDSDFRSSH